MVPAGIQYDSEFIAKQIADYLCGFMLWKTSTAAIQDQWKLFENQ